MATSATARTKWPLGVRTAVVVVLAVLAFVLWANLFPAPTPPALDLTRPVFSKSDAAICPVLVGLDRRSGHDLAAATQAAATFFGKRDAVEKVGCQLWHDGVRIQPAPASKPTDTWMVASTPGGGLEVFLVFGWDLRN